MPLTRIRVEREMDFTPRAPLRVAVLAHLPFTFAIDLQTGAVDNQIDRSLSRRIGSSTSSVFARRQNVV
ncbi:MAG: hypothetical protein E5299_02365 [Burkholderia gladioli]|nr:MAG: hypothetical protein E5299_02365 [Burkholderia gladioli]